MRMIIGGSLTPLNSSRTMRGVRRSDDNSRKKVQNVRGDSSAWPQTLLDIVAGDTERAEAAGEPELAAAIAQQVERMRRQIDYHLAHGRAAPSGATRSQGARSNSRRMVLSAFLLEA